MPVQWSTGHRSTQPPTETTHTGSINKRKSKRRGSEREVAVRRLEARSLFAKNSCGFHCLLLNNWFLNKSCIALQSPARSRPKGLDWLRGRLLSWVLVGWLGSSVEQKQLITNSMLTRKQKRSRLCTQGQWGNKKIKRGSIDCL